MTHDCFSTKRVTVWRQSKDGADGYAIKYRDGYISWCPVDVYERDYNPVEGGHLTFGEAVEALKGGERVRRLGWNGKGMFLFVVVGAWTYTDGKQDNFPDLAFIAMKTVGDEVVPWLASQTDMLSDDWELC
jgi:hypothetical protein